MRIKPFTLAFVVIAVAALAYVFLGVIYLNQQREQENLTAQIALLSPIIQKENQNPDDLEQRLAVAEARLAAEQATLPARLKSTKVIDDILQSAQDRQVKALPLRAQPVSTEKVGEHEYGTLEFTIEAEGEFSDLLSFISKLENGTIKTLAVKTVNLTRSTEGWSATLNLAVYAQSLPSATPTPSPD